MKLLATALLLAAAPAFAEPAADIIGTWKVTSLKATSEGKTAFPLGEKVEGYVTLTSQRMWLLFVDGTRKAPAAPALSDPEAVAMFKTQVAWTGKYASESTADGLKLTAHVDAASSQAIAGHDRVYFVKMNGAKMTMTSPGVIVPMTGALSVVEFEMTKAE